MDLKLRRWSGQVSGGLEDTRLVIRDLESNEKLGHVQVDTGWLFMAQEEQREQVRRALDAHNVDVAGPPIEALAELPYLHEVSAPLEPIRGSRFSRRSSPTTIPTWAGSAGIGTTNHKREAPAGVRRRVPFRSQRADRQPPDFWDGVVGHLRRLGALPLDQEPEELTNAVVDRLNGWSSDQDDDEVENEDEDYFGSAHPAFYGRPLDSGHQAGSRISSSSSCVHKPRRSMLRSSRETQAGG